MRVIAGALKGRRLASPSWEGLRPTSDRLRETLFDVVAARVAGEPVTERRPCARMVRLQADHAHRRDQGVPGVV